jgi:hypothetical protein
LTGITAVALLAAGGAVSAAPATFDSPEAALQAFTAAATAGDGQALLQLFGTEHEDEIIGGDPAARRVEMRRLQRAIGEGAVLVPDANGRMIVTVGRQAWPMPVPLVQVDGRWTFDVDAGLEEIRDRRIGRNELAVIDLMRDYVEAQEVYAAVDRDGDRVREFASRMVSSPGTRDGLYWPRAEGAEPSPVGALLAGAGDYGAEWQKGEPFYGYVFKLLMKQGPRAPGGAYDYVINGNMIAGSALIAWPADYGDSGVMSFIVSNQGEVYEKDLGEATATLAPAIDAYEPDDGWTLVPSDE